MLHEYSEAETLDSSLAAERFELQRTLTAFVNRDRGAGGGQALGMSKVEDVEKKRDPLTGSILNIPRSGQGKFDTRFIPIPSGFRASGQPYTPRNDSNHFLSMKRELALQVASVMGVPGALLANAASGSGSRSTVVEISQQEALNKTIRFWANLLETHLSNIFSFAAEKTVRVTFGKGATDQPPLETAEQSTPPPAKKLRMEEQTEHLP